MVSGLTASLQHPGIVWAHNDSGDAARIFAIDTTTCAIRATVTLAGVTARDFEAISLGRDQTGQPELYVGDTGDNGRTRPDVTLYRFPEPAELVGQTVPVRPVTVTWSDGPRDCEALIVEPVPNGRVYLISKEPTGGLYQLTGDFRSSGHATTGSRIMHVRGYVTDAATNPNRSRTVLRSGDHGTLLTGLPGADPISICFPAQAQGEAVTFSGNGQHLLLVSEGATDLTQVPVPQMKR